MYHDTLMTSGRPRARWSLLFSSLLMISLGAHGCATEDDSSQELETVQFTLASALCDMGELGGPKSCRSEKAWQKLATMACMDADMSLTAVNLGPPCAKNRYKSVTFQCCGDVEPSCTKDYLGAKSACKPENSWKKLAAKACMEMGSELTDFNPVRECAKNRYRYARYSCCETPEPPSGLCDDGEPVICKMSPPFCPKGSIVAIQNGCYECVDPDTCQPPCGSDTHWEDEVGACCPDSLWVADCECGPGAQIHEYEAMDAQGCLLGYGCECVPGPCSDGTDVICDMTPPDCNKMLAIQNGCWACVDPMTCDSAQCGKDEHVVDHHCLPCPPGTTHPGGDDATGDNTSCACESVTGCEPMSPNEIDDFCDAPGECGMPMACEAQTVTLTGFIYYLNTHDPDAPNIQPLKKIAVVEEAIAESPWFEVWASDPDNSKPIFEKINLHKTGDADVSGRVYITGVLDGADLAMMNGCNRVPTMWIDGPDAIVFEELPGQECQCDFGWPDWDATCSPDTPQKCLDCEDGYVLDGDICVPVDACGVPWGDGASCACSPVTGCGPMTSSDIDAYCNAPGPCNTAMSCEGQMVTLTGFVYYLNTHNPNAANIQPLKKIAVVEAPVATSPWFEVWAQDADDSDPIFDKIQMYKPADAGVSSRVYITGLLDGADLYMSNSCSRVANMWVNGPYDVVFEEELFEDCFCDDGACSYDTPDECAVCNEGYALDGGDCVPSNN